jgi:FAD dependent oxidoreductase TIGR03364
MRLVVVGGGIIGTALALEAVGRGCYVVQLERDDVPHGASVRNFGMIWVSGRAAGPELDLALRGRARWQELSDRVPGGLVRPAGSLIVATEPAELQLIEAAAARDDAGWDWTVLDTRAARKREPALSSSVLGALHCPHDALVEPETVLTHLRELAAEAGRYTFQPGRAVVEARSGAVLDHTGSTHRADAVVLATGASLELLGGTEKETVSVRRLQMLEVSGGTPTPAHMLADGNALRYYPAFDLPERALLPLADPEVGRYGCQLLLAPRRTGTMTIGDTHVDEPPVDFASSEEADEYILASAERVLAGGVGAVLRRWQGRYLRRTGGAEPYLCSWVNDGVLAVTAVGGMGMTAAPAIAADVVSLLLGS